MASSLSSQVAVLVPAAEGCMSMSSSFLLSAFECAYFLGCTCGIFWGWASDRLGRRKLAVGGLVGMCLCCLFMGFATSFAVFAVLRFVAGVVSSAVTVAGLAMLADSTHGDKGRTQIVARLPAITVCGSIGSYVANALRDGCAENALGVFSQYPGLSGQIVCASLVLSIALAEGLMLEETLPLPSTTRRTQSATEDPEKAAFLNHAPSNDSDDSLNITIIDALHDDATNSPTSHITLPQLLNAPTIMTLLTSFSILSLHASTFDTLLPHLSHTDSRIGGMGIPCAWLRPLTLLVQILAAHRILTSLPPLLTTKPGLLPLYRCISVAFPPLFALVPIAGAAVHASGSPPIVSALTSTMVMLAKTTLSSAAEVSVLLLVLSAAPDAGSTGTLVGLISISQVFKALAVGVSGVAYFLADGYSVYEVNVLLWTVLVTIAGLGARVTWKLRERPMVGADIPEECLVWEGLFDSESEEESGL